LSHEDGEAHGSGRSISGYHLLKALTEIHQEGSLFTRFGGHAHAVGFSLPSDHVPLLRERIERHSAASLLQEMLAPPLEYDAHMALQDLTPQFYEWIERCAPFGNGHREPVFVSHAVKLVSEVRIIKERHVCLEVSAGEMRFSALGWSRAGVLWADRCRNMGLGVGSVVDLAYRVRQKNNAWYSGLELELVDLRQASPL
jgi:single-stranded-DNA-specific exonuclease